MITAGNCITAANGGSVDNHKSGDDHPMGSDSGCKVITSIYNINVRTQTARAALKNAVGESVGTALLAVADEGVAIATEIHGLSPGKYAIHVHAAGKCDSPDFLSAGPYFNQTRQLPDFEVSVDGKGDAGATMKGATLDGGPNGLLGADGTAIVIEEVAKAGNAPRRVACGVVKPGIELKQY
jgi:Cu-Zn family superoxide dismutase